MSSELDIPTAFGNPTIQQWFETKDVLKTMQLAHVACLGGRKGAVISLARNNLIETFSELQKSLISLAASVEEYNQSSIFNVWGDAYNTDVFAQCKMLFGILQNRLQFVISIF